VSPVTLVTSTVRTLQVQAKQANVKLQLLSNFKDESSELFEVVRRGMCIIGDSMKLSQVIRNVVSNALKFSATGETVAVAGEHSTVPFPPISSLPLSMSGVVRFDPNGLNTVDQEQFSSVIKDFPHLSEFSRHGSLVIEITDHGPGMDQEEMCRLFQEGVQFNPNQLQAGQGSGLGLWISRGLIDLHLGKLSAFSEGLGQGSTFTIEIPLFEPARLPLDGLGDLEMGTPQISQELQASPTQYSVLGTSDQSLDLFQLPQESPKETRRRLVPTDIKKILVVDDAPTNRKIVRRILKSDGFTDVDEAKDGLECVEMVSSRPPHEPWYDLILMDYEMPRMNGPTATSRLRELGYTIPIIGVTGNILSADVAFFIESGADSVLPKPVVMKDLYEAYSVALSGRVSR
jgi:CheY-like chemotaxis protein